MMSVPANVCLALAAVFILLSVLVSASPQECDPKELYVAIVLVVVAMIFEVRHLRREKS